MTAKMKVMAGMSWAMAEPNIADVKAKLSIYKFCANDPLQYFCMLIYK